MSDEQSLWGKEILRKNIQECSCYYSKAHDQTVPLYGSVSSELKNVMVTEPNGEDDGHQISTEQDGVLIINGFPNHKLVSVTLKSSDTDSSKDDGEITPGDAVIKNGDEDVTSYFDITYKNGLLTVKKGIITITENPQAAAITYGQKLKDSALSGGRVNDGKVDVKGTFAWKEKDTVPSVSDSNYVLGTILALGAGTLLVTGRRMKAS